MLHEFCNNSVGSTGLQKQIPSVAVEFVLDSARVVVPDHKQIRAGTLRQILNEAGLTIEEFISLL